MRALKARKMKDHYCLHMLWRPRKVMQSVPTTKALESFTRLRWCRPPLTG